MARGGRDSGASLWEERPPFYRRKRRRREAALGAEENEGDETNRQQNLHRLGSFPQPAARRDEAWRGEAGGGGGARVDVPLVLMLIQVGKEPPL